MKTNTLDFDAQALRDKILDLAMRGKLVPQDPNDEPASVLLEKIKAEKAELVKEKKIKKSKPLPEITDDEKPFDIPDNWEWVRLGDVLTILRGGSPRPIKKYLTNDPDGINWIKIGDSSENSKYIDHAAEKIIPEGLSKTRIVHKGDFLLSNSMSFGRPYILKINGAVHDGWLILSNYESIFNKDYLYYLLSSRFISKQFSSLATGSTVKNLNRERVSNTVALLPPLSEQSRIAAKIAQLFALLRKVESSTQQYAKLQTLLKSKVLDLAMRGKLVKQDPNDEPASELLKKIKAEKAELIKEKKIKKSKPLPPITDDEKPFDIPDSWEWVRLGNVVDIRGGKRVPKGEKLDEVKSYKPYIRVSDMKNETIDLKHLRYANKMIFQQIHNYTISSNDIYFSIAGTIGKVGEVPDVIDGALLTENAARLRLINSTLLIKLFLIDILKSQIVKDQHKKMLSKVAQPKLALIKLKNTMIPIPPVSEQKSISTKLINLGQIL